MEELSCKTIDIDYHPVVLAFVLGVHSHPLFAKLKPELIKAIKKIESDDKLYVYDSETVYKTVGQAVGHIANYICPRNINLGEALRKTLAVLASEDYDTRKFVFVFTDRLDATSRYDLGKSLNYNVNKDLGCDVKLFISSKCSDGMECVSFEDAEGIGEKLLGIYKN